MMTTGAHDQLAVIYARFSDPKQDARSITDQVRRCEQYAEREALTIVGVYSDEGITGRHSAREGYQRMLEDAKARRFRYVLIFDIARLGRSLGVLWDTVFGRLRRLGVVVIDVSTNTRSDSSNARMVFGTMGLVSDLWCVMIGDETRKALEGRARSGFHPGGKTYGYRSVPEEHPEDPAHPRKVRIIDPEEAKVVVDIFTMYADGLGAKAIAAELNLRGLRAPHDGRRGNKRFEGWGHGTIRYMLRNEEYRGRDKWGERRWQLLDDGRYQVEPQDDGAKRVDYSVPSIVSQELWDRVNARLKRTRGRGPRKEFGSGRHRGWLFSGHAQCGLCSGPIMVASRKHTADGRHYANLGCATYDRTGGTKCTNNRTVSEKKLVDAVVGEIRNLLTTPEFLQEFVLAAERSFRDAQRRDSGSSDEAERRVRECQRRVDNLTESLAATGFSAAVVDRLDKEERALAEAQQGLAALRRGAGTLASPKLEQLRRGVDRLLEFLDGEDMPKARQELIRHMPPLVLMPVTKGWEVQGGFDYSILLGIGSVEGVGGTGIELAGAKPKTKGVAPTCNVFDELRSLSVATEFRGEPCRGGVGGNLVAKSSPKRRQNLLPEEQLVPALVVSLGLEPRGNSARPSGFWRKRAPLRSHEVKAAVRATQPPVCVLIASIYNGDTRDGRGADQSRGEMTKLSQTVVVVASLLLFGCSSSSSPVGTGGLTGTTGESVGGQTGGGGGTGGGGDFVASTSPVGGSPSTGGAGKTVPASMATGGTTSTGGTLGTGAMAGTTEKPVGGQTGAGGGTGGGGQIVVSTGPVGGNTSTGGAGKTVPASTATGGTSGTTAPGSTATGGSSGGGSDTGAGQVTCSVLDTGCTCLAGKPGATDPATCSKTSVAKGESDKGSCCKASVFCTCTSYSCVLDTSLNRCMCGTTYTLAAVLPTGTKQSGCRMRIGSGYKCCHDSTLNSCTCGLTVCDVTATEVPECTFALLTTCPSGQVAVDSCK